MLLTAAIAITEFILAGLVWFKGKTLPKTIALILLFLAFYQLGELIAFASDDYSKEGVQFAYFATTLLPPLGLLVLQKITKQNFGYLILQAFGLFFAINFLIDPSIIEAYTIDEVFIRVDVSSELFRYWAYPYYLGGLTYTMLITAYYAFRAKNLEVRKFMWMFLAAYTSFYIVAVVFTLFFPSLKSALASFMCALAITAALIMSWGSFYFDPKKLGLDEENPNTVLGFLKRFNV